MGVIFDEELDEEDELNIEEVMKLNDVDAQEEEKECN